MPVCACIIKGLWFSRIHDDPPWTITETDIEQLCMSTEFPLSYIGRVAQLDFRNLAFTTNFTKVTNAITSYFVTDNQHKCICLEGPKRFGKTYTLAATFAVCYLQKQRPCLFLTEGSFDNSIHCKVCDELCFLC